MSVSLLLGSYQPFGYTQNQYDVLIWAFSLSYYALIYRSSFRIYSTGINTTSFNDMPYLFFWPSSIQETLIELDVSLLLSIYHLSIYSYHNYIKT